MLLILLRAGGWAGHVFLTTMAKAQELGPTTQVLLLPQVCSVSTEQGESRDGANSNEAREPQEIDPTFSHIRQTRRLRKLHVVFAQARLVLRMFLEKKTFPLKLD